MKMLLNNTKQLSAVLVCSVLALGVSTAQAVIDGISGTTFNLTASADRVSTADGNSVYFWGYGETGTRAQYPGPTLIVNQGDTITINLTNNLSANTSIIFPGQEGVNTTAAATASGGTQTYTFTASHAGTYLYNSGTDMDLQIEMGLVGVIIVRPPQTGWAYNHADSAYNREFLYLQTEMDLDIHLGQETLDNGGTIDMAAFAAHRTNPRYEYWFLNGRTAVDTLFPAAAGAPWLPTQPYNSLPLMHPGEKLLLRVISGGRDGHPLHTHGNNALIIAKDGRLLSNGDTTGSDKAYSDNTFFVMPGSTWDIIFEWTGKGLGWDIYNHLANFQNEAQCLKSAPLPYEDPDSHCKPFPVQLPGNQDLTFGGFWSGSAFLGGDNGLLPPGEGGLNPFNGYFFPWHSHHEKELTNFDIYPGGILTFFAVVPLDFPLPLPY